MAIILILLFLFAALGSSVSSQSAIFNVWQPPTWAAIYEFIIGKHKRTRRSLAPSYGSSAWTHAQIILYFIFQIIYLYSLLISSAAARWQPFVSTRSDGMSSRFRCACGIPRWPGGHHSRGEVVSSRVAVPPMICIVILYPQLWFIYTIT